MARAASSCQRYRKYMSHPSFAILACLREHPLRAKVVAINDPMLTVEQMHYLLYHDSVYGAFEGNVKIRYRSYVPTSSLPSSRPS